MSKWYTEAFFYHIYPLGLCGAEPENPLLNGRDAKGEDASITHRLEEITGWLLHMKELGITALYLGPLFESESHGYDTLDYFTVDRRLGDNQDLKNLVKECHQLDIRVILDGVFNHVSRHFFAFEDVLKNNKDSIYVNWISGLDLAGNNSSGDGLSYEGWDGHESLVTLNLENHDTREHLFDAVRFWIDTFDIDGIRLDAADCLDDNFIQDLSLVCAHKKDDFFLLGEIIHGDYTHWANPNMLHSVTNYEVWKGLWSSIKDRNMFEIAWTLKREFGDEGLYRGLPLYNFADNHDVDRIIEKLDNPVHLYPLYLLMFCIPGIPSLYYGSEIGLKGAKNGPDDSGMRPRLRIDEFMRNAEHYDLAGTIARLAEIRKDSIALKYGEYKELHVSSEQLVFIRESLHDDTVVCCLNIADDAAEISIDAHGFQRATDLLNREDLNIYAYNGRFSFPVSPAWGRILRLE